MPVAHTMYSFSLSMFVLHNTGRLLYRIVFPTIFLSQGVLCRWKLGNCYTELYSLQLRTTTSTPVVDKRDQALISGISIDTFIYAAHSSLGVRLIDISHMYQRIIQGLCLSRKATTMPCSDLMYYRSRTFCTYYDRMCQNMYYSDTKKWF